MDTYDHINRNIRRRTGRAWWTYDRDEDHQHDQALAKDVLAPKYVPLSEQEVTD